MKVDQGDVPFAGFLAQEIDFPSLFARSSQTQQDLLNTMIESAVTAESDPSAGRFCEVVIVGHSDRDDTAGLSPEQRRANELQNSTLRAESAQAFFFEELFNRLKNEGFTAPVDMASMQNVDLVTVACGAADLNHTVPANEAERQENRRVHFIGMVFTPG